MKQTVLISIVVPVYNAEKYLDKCISSIINQTYTNFELLLVDDGSNDSSYQKCYKYAENDSRIQVLRHENRGVSYTRNRGIKAANGNYITFIDSDDWVDDTYLEDFLVYELSMNSIVVQGIEYDFWNNTTKTLFSYPNGSYNRQNFSETITQNRLFHDGCPVAKLFEKSIIVNNNIYFDENISLNEDHLFVLEYYKYVDNIYLTSSLNYHYYFDYFMITLTRKVHSFTMLNTVSKKFIDVIPDLISRYELSDRNYISSLYTSCGISQMIQAIINSYYLRERKYYAKERFSYASGMKAFILDKYVPDKFLLRISKFFITKFNYRINNCFFYILALWLKIRKSAIRKIRKILRKY